MKQSIIFLMGPTASGKTSLAIEAVQRGGVEVVSVDSAMIYKGMDIGTAKPSLTELAIAPHRLIDICRPQDTYSVAAFCHAAAAEIKDIHERGHIPLLVGGTMMYFNALLYGLSDIPETDPSIRASLLQEVDTLGLAVLYERLKQVDAGAANKIHGNDSQRILRALEVFTSTGKTLSQFQNSRTSVLKNYNISAFAIDAGDRHILHSRIAARFQDMLNHQFIDEVASFHAQPDMHENLPSMRSVGYRQVWQYLSGQFGYEEMQARGIAATRQLAKRQLTWLRNWKSELQWISLEEKQAFFNQLEALSQADT